MKIVACLTPLLLSSMLFAEPVPVDSAQWQPLRGTAKFPGDEIVITQNDVQIIARPPSFDPAKGFEMSFELTVRDIPTNPEKTPTVSIAAIATPDQGKSGLGVRLINSEDRVRLQICYLDKGGFGSVQTRSLPKFVVGEPYRIVLKATPQGNGLYLCEAEILGMDGAAIGSISRPTHKPVELADARLMLWARSFSTPDRQTTFRDIHFENIPAK